LLGAGEAVAGGSPTRLFLDFDARRDYLDKHQPRGVSLEHVRRDRILHEALAAGADPLHLALVFRIDHTNAMAYANAARNLLTSPAEQALSRRPK
jgi:hypothetical protein